MSLRQYGLSIFLALRLRAQAIHLLQLGSFLDHHVLRIAYFNADLAREVERRAVGCPAKGRCLQFEGECLDSAQRILHLSCASRPRITGLWEFKTFSGIDHDDFVHRAILIRVGESRSELSFGISISHFDNLLIDCVLIDSDH
jgi:hypothetical protein